MFARCLVILLGACASQAPHGPQPDPCLPAGLDLDTLDPPAQSILMRRALVCNDHRQGRITDGEFATRVAALDAELAGKRIAKRKPRPEASDQMIVWAASVLDVSSQYSEEAWSANQVLGAPDVFPAYGDHNKAWASQGADDREEWIEVGFGGDERVSGVEIYETFNPGAIDKVELITVKGRRIEVAIPSDTAPPGTSVKRVFDVRCTQELVRSVRVHLDSQRVSGWNELDAIGVMPCTR